MLRPRAREVLRSATRRAVSALLVAVQLVALVASLTELQGQPGQPLSPTVGARVVPVGDSGAWSEQQRARHDEATCPACIVRSLHARVETQARLPITVIHQSDAALPSLTLLPPTTTARSNLSRAPPIVG
jgi:hypothetical protein